MKKITTILASFLLSSLALAAPHDHGFYIEGNVGTIHSDVSLFGQHVSNFGGVGLNANLGLLAGRYFGAEVGYTRYMDNSLGLNNADLALKAILPFNIGKQDFNLYVKAGPAYIFDDSQNSTWKPLFGIGAAYQVTQKLDVDLQAQGVHFGGFDNVNATITLISLGLAYHFDI